MPKHHIIDIADHGSNAPSHNFIYDFEVFRYWVRDDWRQVYSQAADGSTDGSMDALEEAVIGGSEVKVGIRGLCADLAPVGETPLEHEVFVRAGSGYHYTEKRRLTVGTHPLVRVRPAAPMRYASKAWDFGWLVLSHRRFCRSPVIRSLQPDLL